MLTARTGVCYDWGILFAVMARYVGVESYVHTGILRIGTWTGHHGWTELRLGGKNYIFDGQPPGLALQGDLRPDRLRPLRHLHGQRLALPAGDGPPTAPGTPACCRWTPPGCGWPT